MLQPGSRKQCLDCCERLEVAVKTTEVIGLAAGRHYLGFFFDPVGTICRLYQQYGPVTALGKVKFKQPRDLLLFAIGPEFNRLLFSDPSLFRPTGLILPGPKNSAQRRVRFGLTRMVGDQHRQQRQLVAPPFHRCAVRGYHRIMVDVVKTEIAEWKTGIGINIHAKVRALTLRIATFATQVLKISLAMIMQRFRFTVVPGARINRIVVISMNPRHGLPMIVAKKDRNYSVSEVCGQIREMVDFSENGAG